MREQEGEFTEQELGEDDSERTGRHLGADERLG